MENIKKTAKEICKKALPFLRKYNRYIITAGLFVVMLLTVYFFTGEDYVAKRIATLNNKEVSGDDYVPAKEFSVNEYAELNELISMYFGAYVHRDFETLRSIAAPVSEMEESYITTIGQFYEEYRNITCYSKQGLSKNSHIVAVTFDIKFVDQETVAPSMVLFYVQTNENGELYINNLYSDFNLKYVEENIRKDVLKALQKFTQSDDYIELQNKVQTDYNQLIKENEAIYQLTKRTIPAMRQEWEDTIYYAHNKDTETESGTEVETGTEAGTELVPPATEPETAPPETQQPQPEPEPEPEPVVIKVKVTTEAAKIREGASTNTEQIGRAEEGDIFVKLGEEGNWTKIEFEDGVGYISTSLVEEITE